MKNIFVILLIVVFTACENNATQEPSTDTASANENAVQLNEVQLKNAGIETGKATQKNIASVLKVSGVIDVPPQNMVSISVPLGGYLKSTKLLPGMHVSKGEVIAVMEDQQYIQLQQDFLSAKARAVYANLEYDRQKELNQSKASSDKVFQQAEAEYNAQKILVKSLSEKLLLIGINPEILTTNNLSRSISVHSPINGFVSKVNVNIGKYVNPADVLFEIVNPDDIHLALTIFENDINKLFTGQNLVAYTNSNPGKKYPCKIILIGKDFSTDRSIEVHCHFEQYDKTLIPGMFMNAEIEAENNNAWTLPSDAIVNYENKDYVFVKKEQEGFEMLEIKTGNSQNGYSEIITNDSTQFTDKIFVTKGAYSLLMKMKNSADE